MNMQIRKKELKRKYKEIERKESFLKETLTIENLIVFTIMTIFSILIKN